MLASDAKLVLLQVKAYWYRQPVDDLTVSGWVQLLADADVRDAAAAVREYAELGGEESPAPGAVRRRAREIAARREDAERRQRRALEEPKPSVEQIAENRRLLRELTEKIGRRGSPGRGNGGAAGDVRSGAAASETPVGPDESSVPNDAERGEHRGPGAGDKKK